MAISMDRPPPTAVHRVEKFLRSPSRPGKGGSRSTGAALAVLGIAFASIAACASDDEASTGTSSDTTEVVADDTTAGPLALTEVHEWKHAEVRFPGNWSVTRDASSDFTVASEPDLILGNGLTTGQVSVLIGYTVAAPDLEKPLAEAKADLFELWDLELDDVTTMTMLGHPTEIVTASGEQFGFFVARVLTDVDTALTFQGYVAPGEMTRFRPTFEEMIETATLRGLLDGPPEPAS